MNPALTSDREWVKIDDLAPQMLSLDDMPIEWCNAYTGERHRAYSSVGIARAMLLGTHVRKILPDPDLPLQ